MEEPELKVLVSGLVYPECARWHQGMLWFSDMHGRRIVKMDEAGGTQEVVRLSDRPGGLGFLPDGTLLIVGMQERNVMRFDDNGLKVWLDFPDVPGAFLNDMVVDTQGRAYIGNMDRRPGLPRFDSDNVILVYPDGTYRLAAEGVTAPNGMAITADGKTLILAETMARRLSAFDIAEDGTLQNSRVFATLGNAIADGICLDANEEVWVGTASSTNEFLRVAEGGQVTARIHLDRGCVACVLGGEDRRTLYALTSRTTGEEIGKAIADKTYTPKSEGWIEAGQVGTPGAGIP